MAFQLKLPFLPFEGTFLYNLILFLNRAVVPSVIIAFPLISFIQVQYCIPQFPLENFIFQKVPDSSVLSFSQFSCSVKQQGVLQPLPGWDVSP